MASLGLNTGRKTTSYGLQYLIPGHVSVRIIDVFESVNVNEEHGKLIIALSG